MDKVPVNCERFEVGFIHKVRLVLGQNLAIRIGSFTRPTTSCFCDPYEVR
jgi:hypothetical protein